MWGPYACKVHLFLQREEQGSPGASSLGTWRRDQGPPRPARGPSRGGKKRHVLQTVPWPGRAWPRCGRALWPSSGSRAGKTQGPRSAVRASRSEVLPPCREEFSPPRSPPPIRLLSKSFSKTFLSPTLSALPAIAQRAPRVPIGGLLASQTCRHLDTVQGAGGAVAAIGNPLGITLAAVPHPNIFPSQLSAALLVS